MQPIRIGPAGLIASKILILFAGLNCLSALSLQAAAPPATVRLQNAGVDAEGLQTFRLEWNSVSNATYRVQRSDSLGSNALWKAVDVVTPVGGASQLEIKGRSIPENSVEFYRLLLPQPEIFSVEPAVIAPGVLVDIFVVGQCFGSNDVLRINGVPQTNVFQSSSLLSRPSFTPDVAGTYVFELVVAGLVVSSFNVICADAAANLELVFQGPPELPPASPQGVYSSRKGYEYYQAQSQLNSEGLHNNPAFQPNNNAGEMPRGHRAAFLSKKGYDYYQFNTTARFSGGGDDDCDGEADDSFDALTVEQCNFFAQDGKVTICHGTAAVAGGIAGGAVAGIVIAAREASVTPFSGEVQQQVVDLAVEGRGLDFIWARTYHSRLGRFDTAANGWTFSYDVRCAQNSSGDVDVYDGTGRKDTFKLQTNGVYTCPEFFREGTLTKGVFRLTFADTGYWEFNPLDAATPDSKLSRIVDRNGNTMSLDYDGSGRLMQIVDDLGRTNSVRYDAAGRIAAVTDFSGRTVTYSYYAGELGGSRGDLKSVTSPPVTGTPNKNDFPEGKTTTYTYSTGYRDERENHLLLSEMDAQGQTVSQHVYQHNQRDLDFLRCVSVQRWTNTPTRLSYLPQTPTPANQFAVLRCVMNDPVGNVTEYFYDARNRCVKLQEFTGRSTPGVPVTATGNRPSGKVRPSDPDFYECRAEWNNDSLCRKLVMFGGQRMECVYESDLDKSTPARKRADLRALREFACCGGADMDGDGIMDLTQRVSRYEYDPRFGSDPSSEGCKVVKEIAYAMYKSRTSATVDSARIITDRDSGRSKGFGFVISATDPRGNEIKIAYDATGNPTNTARRSQLAFAYIYWTAMTYNPQGELTNYTHPPDANQRRRVDTFAYSQGQVIQSIEDAGADGLNLATTFERDLRGNLTRCVDPRGNDHLFTYNALDQCVRVQTPVNLTARCATDYFYDANDNLVSCATEIRSETDALLGSKVDRCEVDPLHRITRIVSAVDATHSLTNDFVYDGNDQYVLALGGDAVSGADPFQTVSLQYDERGLLFRVSSAPGSGDQKSAQYDYDSNGNLTRVSKGLEGTPQVTTMEYDGFASSSGKDVGQFRANISVISRDTGGNEQMRMAGNIRMLTSRRELIEKERFHHAANTVYNVQVESALSWVETVWNKQCVEKDTTMRMSGSAGVSKITDAMGNVTTFNYDANNNLKLVRHFGQTNDVPGAEGNIRLAESRYEYDGLDRRVRSRDSFFSPETQAPIGDGERTTSFAYAPNGQCTSVTDDLGRVTSYTYDTRGWLASVISPGGKSVMGSLKDAAGNLITVTQTDLSDLGGAPQVFSWTNVYDSLNRCVSTTDNVGNTSSCAFDSLDRIAKTTDPRGVSSFYTYDLLGRQTIAVGDLDGDGNPNLTQDITSMATWSSSSGRLLATTDSHGNTTSYAYDSRSRCTNVTSADGTQRKLIWSPRSNLISEQDANGTVVLHTYDLNDRCISKNITPGAMVAATTTTEQFAYDGLSRRVAALNNGLETAFTYDSLGNRTRDISGGIGALTTFDSVGNRISLTYPGGRALTYAYDVLDRCTNILESGASLASFDYDGPGRVARISYRNGMRSRIFYDGISGAPNASDDFGHGQISRIRHAMAGGLPVISEVSLAWDRNQNKTVRQDAIFAPAIPRTNAMTLGYDAANRLTLATVLSGSTLLRDTIYGLDRMGNRTNVLGAASCSGNYVMDAAVPGPRDFQMNQYTDTPCDSRSYDENGNLVSRSSAVGPVNYQYDFANRLVQVQALDSSTGALSPVAAYNYDALGRRVSKTVFSAGLPPSTTQFIYDGDSVIEERVAGVVSQVFVHGGGLSEEIRENDEVSGRIASITGAGEVRYYHTDDQGNVLALTGANRAVLERYDYDDYGAVTFLTSDGTPTSATSSAVGNVYCWGGLRLDAETGLQNDDGGSYFETQNGRCLARAQDDLQRTGSIVQLRAMTVNEARPMEPRVRGGGGGARNNPWTGGSPNTMEKGTVKFFNEAKGFGRMMKEEGGRHTPFHNGKRSP